MDFSAVLLNRAMRASNGELGFPRRDTAQAISELERAGLAVLGGEVWLEPAGGPSLLIGRNGHAAVYAWSAEHWREGESWADFVARTALHARAAVEGLRPEDDLDPSTAAQVRFNLTYVDEAEYRDLVHR